MKESSGYWKAAIYLLIGLFIFMSHTAWAEFYKYKDADGVVRFTDDLSQVPAEQRENMKGYSEVKSSPEKNGAAVGIPEVKKKGSGEVPSSPDTAEMQALKAERERLKARRAELEKELEALNREREAIQPKKKVTKNKYKARQYVQKREQLNEKYRQFEQKRKKYDSDLKAYENRMKVYNQLQQNPAVSE